MKKSRLKTLEKCLETEVSESSIFSVSSEAMKNQVVARCWYPALSKRNTWMNDDRWRFDSYMVPKTYDFHDQFWLSKNVHCFCLEIGKKCLLALAILFSSHFMFQKKTASPDMVLT